MMRRLADTRIRTRLIIAYVGTLLLGFVALMLASGQQIASSARADYERQLASEVRLIAASMSAQASPDSSYQSLLQAYQANTQGQLQLIARQGEFEPDEDDRGGRPTFRDQPEMETALRGETVVVSRTDRDGVPTLYTAAMLAPVDGRAAQDTHDDDHFEGQPPQMLLQLATPLTALNGIIAQRWAALLLICLLITTVALVIALLLARSIIQPLNALRESAHILSSGDLSHRVAYDHHDEIGEVAHAFNDMAQQVQSMLDEQRAFASNTSHELRTPLTTIRLRTEALRDDPELDPALARQYVGEIDDEVRRLGDLIEDLTLLSRLDAGRAELGREQYDLVQVAHSLRQRVQSQADAKGLTLTVDSTTDSAPVRASLTHLTIVFRNLLDNAIKYTPAGSITWTIRADAEAVTSTIRDTGVGLTSDQLPHLFERFYRADKARTRNIPGTGLGLTMVQSIVTVYGGSVHVASDGLDRGTTVTVVWPRSIDNS